MKRIFGTRSSVAALTVSLALAVPTAGGATSAAPETQATSETQAVPGAQAAAEGADPREAVLAERLEFALLGGEILWIEAAGEKFLAILRAATGAATQGGIVINAPIGAIVDGLPLHQTLARTAAAAGWFVLSIQQPIPESRTIALHDGELTARAGLRLDAGIDYLANQGIANVVIIGAAAGAAIAIRHFAGKVPPTVTGFVGLGAWDAPLDEVDIPVLGVAGTRDARAVSLQSLRMARLGARVTPVEVLEVDGAGPAFLGYEALVAKRVRGWLKRMAPGATVKRTGAAVARPVP